MNIRIEFQKFSKDYKDIRNLKNIVICGVPCLTFESRGEKMTFNLNNVLFYAVDSDDYGR